MVRHHSSTQTAASSRPARCRAAFEAVAALDLGIVLVDAVSSLSTGQLKWQNGRTGRVSRQPGRRTCHRTRTTCPVTGISARFGASDLGGPS